MPVSCDRTVTPQDYPSLYCSLNAAGVIQAINPLAAESLGYTPEAVLQRPIWELFDAADQPRLQAVVVASRTLAKPPCDPARLLKSNGQTVLVNVAIQAFQGTDQQTSLLLTCTGVPAAQAQANPRTDFLLALLNYTPTPIWLTTAEQRLSFVNRAWEEVWGKQQEEVVGCRIDELFPAAIAQQFMADNQQVIDTGNPISIEECMDTVHGFRYFHAIKFPLFNALGQVETVGGISIDITQRKQAEAELRRSEERWQLAIQGSHDGIWDVNIQTHENFSSVRCATMLGYEAQELGNSYPDWVRYIHPDDVKQVLAATQAHLDQKTPFYFAEYRVRCKDGSYKWILNRGQAIWDQQGKPIRMVGSQTDISDRKQAEEALRDSEARFRKIFADAPIGMAILTLDGQMPQVNQSLCQMLNYSEPELTTLSFYEVMHPGDREHYLMLTQQLLNQEIAQYKMEKRLLKKNGEVVWVSLIAALFQEPDSGAIYQLGMFENITEQRAIEQMKDNFVSVVSHELRTPLTSIRGSLGLLATGQLGILNTEGHEILNIAISESNRLVRLVSDILDLGRLQSGHISLVKESCYIPDLMTRCIDSMRSLTQDTGIKIEVLAVPEKVWADGDRLLQAITNLLNNAIKFSALGSTVWLTVKLMTPMPKIEDQIPATPSLLLFEVQDQGRGIPAEKLKIIFEPFEQVDVTDFRHQGGSGLGLAICQSIIQAHGGQIWATSTLGVGSSFFFTLPCILSSNPVSNSLPK